MTLEGRKALECLKELCGEGRDLFTGSADDRQLCYLEGRRSIYLDIIRYIEEADNDNEAKGRGDAK